MNEAQPSTSGSEESHRQGQFIVHQIVKTDNLAGLAVRYGVSVSDIKRANGLLSDTAMFAKDTLLIPTQALPVGPECATWAGMIVSQFGRVSNGAHRQAMQGFTPSAALDQLQQYYGTAGDTVSEPGDFKPGYGRSDSEAGDMEMTTLDLHTSREAVTADAMPSDRRLRRRRPEESPSRFGSSASLAGASDDEFAPSTLPPPAGTGPGRPPLHAPIRSRTPPPIPPSLHDLPAPRNIARSSAGAASAQPPGSFHTASGASAGHQRKESFLDKIKRAASQPALAGNPAQPSLSRMGDAAIASLNAAPRVPSENGNTAMQRVASAVPFKREKDSAKKA
ncbi:hypothetical protein WJX73_004393 [Symbiochloris irregularis]|uniref:LysM domain-containing protein n=1 Tax=Symbiochloris irregularis TaxID=706552 RepID=A0AAW1NZM9_9CHLO